MGRQHKIENPQERRRRKQGTSKPGSVWGRLGILALVPLVLYTMYAMAERSVHTYRLRSEASVLRAEIEAEKVENLRLQQELVDARGDQPIEDAARRFLNLVRPGDNAIVLVGAEPPPTPTAQPVARPVLADEPPAWLKWLLSRLGL